MAAIIRAETAEDIGAIAEVTAAAFRTHPFSAHTEQFIIAALRAAGALTISLAADVDGRVVGHIAFSPVAISNGAAGWYGLGPVSVLPKVQKRGIGKSLINRGLALLKEQGAQGCALVGNPEYYKRFGFRNYPEFIYDGVPPEVFLASPFTKAVPKGTVTFHEAFQASA